MLPPELVPGMEICPTSTKPTSASQAESTPDPHTQEMFVKVPDIAKQPLGVPELVVIKNGLKADESSWVRSL